MQSLNAPQVLTNTEGNIISIKQYDDWVVLHSPRRHAPASRGRESVCTNRGCEQEAVIDKLIVGRLSPSWRAVCPDCGRSLANKVSPAMGIYLVLMLKQLAAVTTS